MNADGTGVRRLTHSPKFDIPGRGRRTAAGCCSTASARRKGDVWVMNADGSRQRNLTRNAAHDGGGTWSPDGRTIAFGTRPRRQRRALRHERRRQRPAEPRAQPVVARGRRLVAGRAHDRVHHRPGRQLGDLRHGRGRQQSAEPDPPPWQRRRDPGSAGSLVAGRAARIAFASTRDTRDREQPRDLRHERGRERPAQADEGSRRRRSDLLVARRAQARLRPLAGHAALGVLRHERRRERRPEGQLGAPRKR